MLIKSTRIFKKFQRNGWIQPAITIFGIPIPKNVKIDRKITIPEHNIDFVPMSEDIEFECQQLLGDKIWGPFQLDDYDKSVIPGHFPLPKLSGDCSELDNILNHDIDKIIDYNDSLNTHNYSTTESTIKDYYGYYVFGLQSFHKQKE